MASFRTPANDAASEALKRPRLCSPQHLAHPLDQLGFGRGELGALAKLEIIGAVFGRLGEFGPEPEIADRHLRAVRRVALVRALDDCDAAAAPVGIFELRVHAAGAQVEFGRYS